MIAGCLGRRCCLKRKASKYYDDSFFMGKNIYIEGSIYATTGDLYSHNVIVGGSFHQEDAETITPPNGVFEITKDTGSIFDTYFVRDGVTVSGILGVSKGAICAFADIYEFTIRDYLEDMRLIESMLEAIPEAPRCQNLYLQQQYASIFSLLEKFLSFSFVRQTCDNEESYRRVLASSFLQQKYGKTILNGPDCLEKELKYIELANRVVYHNQKAVKTLFNVAFGIDVDLTPLEEDLRIRNDIMHRFGHSEKGADIVISLDEVRVLMQKVNSIATNTAKQILALSTATQN